MFPVTERGRDGTSERDILQKYQFLRKEQKLTVFPTCRELGGRQDGWDCRAHQDLHQEERSGDEILAPRTSHLNLKILRNVKQLHLNNKEKY